MSCYLGDRSATPAKQSETLISLLLSLLQKNVYPRQCTLVLTGSFLVGMDVVALFFRLVNSDRVAVVTTGTPALFIERRVIITVKRSYETEIFSV